MAQGSGSIVNISGTVVFYGTWPHLAAVKAGVHGLTRGLAREFGPHGIRVNIVVPSTIDTTVPVPRDPDRLAAELARTPLGRTGTTREVADVVAFPRKRPLQLCHGPDDPSERRPVHAVIGAPAAPISS